MSKTKLQKIFCEKCNKHFIFQMIKYNNNDYHLDDQGNLKYEYCEREYVTVSSCKRHINQYCKEAPTDEGNSNNESNEEQRGKEIKLISNFNNTRSTSYIQNLQIENVELKTKNKLLKQDLLKCNKFF